MDLNFIFWNLSVCIINVNNVKYLIILTWKLRNVKCMLLLRGWDEIISMPKIISTAYETFFIIKENIL